MIRGAFLGKKRPLPIFYPPQAKIIMIISGKCYNKIEGGNMLKFHRMFYAVLILGLIFLSGCAATKPSLVPDQERWLEVNQPDGTLCIMEYLFGPDNWVRLDKAGDALWSTGSGAKVRVVAKYSAISQNLWADTQELCKFDGVNFSSLSSGPSAQIKDVKTFRLINKSGGVDWSSLASQNPDSRNHIIVFKITKHGGVNYSLGDYVIAWEDSGEAGDYDYNDFVVLLHNIQPVK